MTETTIPAGYWQDANGNLIPEAKVKEIDKLRHQVVVYLCRMAQQHRDGLVTFKRHAMDEVAALVATSVEQYGVKAGGAKGNVTLVSFDGRYKLALAMQDQIVFGEQLMAAKALIDECVRDWSQGANDNVRALVTHAFQTDKAGKINTGRVLGLRQLNITDEKWLKAMQAIGDSIRVTSSKPYVRFYQRDDKTGDYAHISLDAAAV